MKIIFISLIALIGILTASAAQSSDTTTTVTSLDDIIAMETQSQMKNSIAMRLQDQWSKSTFLNIGYNMTKLSSKEFPATATRLANEFDNKLGLGIQWGHTFNFHKYPLGSVLFIGLDFTWLDFNFNQYKKCDAPVGFDLGEQVLNLPWHNEKMSLNYGMSVGPSLTLYPFTSLQNSGTDKIRLQLYFHVGYDVAYYQIKDVPEKGNNQETSKKSAWGHGLYTSFGGNITWDFIGVGIESRNDGGINCKPVDDLYNTGKFKIKEKTTRLYLQFRF